MGGADEVLVFVNNINLKNRLGSMYFGAPPEVVFRPSRHFLDRPHPLYRDNEKVILYTSGGCGVDGFERILVKITVEEDRIIWSDFDHQISLRPIEPKIGLTFIFDRGPYESELAKEYVVKNDFLIDYIKLKK